MATLTNTKIKDTYKSLLKVSDNGNLEAGLQEITDGEGNVSGVQLNTGGDLTASGTVAFGSLKDSGENITIAKFVDEADGIAGNDNDTSIPTSAAVKDYVDTKVTAEDLDFAGDSGTGAVDLDSQTFTIAGTANEIETSASGQTITIGLPSSVTVGTLSATTLGGTLSTAAQPNITSVGTLSSLTVSGALNGTLSTAAQPNITSVGTLSSLAVSGNLTVDTNTLYVDATNNRVGIGTASPDAKFTLLDGATFFKIYQDSTNEMMLTVDTGERMLFGIGGIEKMRIDNAGNVGIGTSSPDTKIHIKSGLDNNVAKFESEDSTASILLNDTTGAVRFRQSLADFFIENDYDNTVADSNIIFRIDNSEKLRIDSSGNVGVKKDALLAAGLGYAGDTTSAGAGKIELYDSSTGALVINGFGAGYLANSGIHFQVAGSEKMRIDSSGRVLIGKSSSDFSTSGLELRSNEILATRSGATVLSLNRLTSDGSILTLVKDTTTVGSIGSASGGIYFGSGSSSTERMRITSGGDVLIGTTGVPNGTSVYGSGFTSETSDRMLLRLATSTSGASNLVQFANTNGLVGYIRTDGLLTIYATSSDYRLKENVVEMTGALDRVDALKPSRFNFIADPEKTVDGFLAHEVAEVVPEAITGEKDAVDEEGNPIYQGIDQSKIVPLLVGAIKELRAEIETLKSQLNA